MKDLSVFVRSKLLDFKDLKVPSAFNLYSTFRDDDTIPLTPSNINYELTESNSFSNTFIENQSLSYQNVNTSGATKMAKSTSNSLSFDPKMNNNLINEWQASYNITNAIQGMFVVSLPFAVSRGGWWSILAMLLVSYVCSFTGKILVDCLYDERDDEKVDFFAGKFLIPLKISQSKRQKRVYNSYVEIADSVLGKTFGGRAVNVAQNIELLMTCILYLVLCGDLFVGSFPGRLDHASWTIIACMLLIPCAFISSLKLVSRLSFCNAIVHLAINVIILMYCAMRFDTWDFSKVTFKLDIYSFPISLGIIVFSYTSQIFLPTLEANMVDRTKFDSMLNLTHLVAAVFKASFGLICFLHWQEATEEVITNNLPTVEFKFLINMILVVKALLSYPLPYFASVELLEQTLFLAPEKTLVDMPDIAAHTKPDPTNKPIFSTSCYEPDGSIKFWAICLRILLILFTLFLAIFIPHFALLMGLIGSITGTLLSLIWPCFFHLKLKKNSLTKYQKAVDVCIIFFGILISVIGVYYSSTALNRALHSGESISLKSQYYKKNTLLNVKNFGNATKDGY